MRQDRARLEHLLRYALRPPLALERLHRLEDGRMLLELKRAMHDGTRAVAFTFDRSRHQSEHAPMSINPSQHRFNQWANTYDRSILQRLLFEPVHDAVLDAFSASSAPPREVLDVGCGTGRLLETAAGRWDHVRLTGVDASEEMIAQAQRKHVGDQRYVFKHGDASALPIESNSCDAVFSTLSFHHWGDQTAGLREIERVMRPGAVFVLADMDPPLPWLLKPLYRVGNHANLQSPKDIERLFHEAGLLAEAPRRFWTVLRTQLFVARKVGAKAPN